LSVRKLEDIVTYLDRELKLDAFRDTSANGLQVANSGTVRKVCCGVDASSEFFREAERHGADLLICHHGISWGDSLKRIAGLNYRWLKFLFDHDMALYACHLPLDAHPRFGNNAQIGRALKLTRLKPFGEYAGSPIGFEGVLAKPLSYTAFKTRVATVMNNAIQCMDFGPKIVSRVAVVSGGAADEIVEAGRKGIDVYVSGEPQLMAYNMAMEYGVNAIFAGHYATEVFGPRAIGAQVAHRFALDVEFIDLRVPF